MWDLAFVGRDIGGAVVRGQRVRVVVVVVDDVLGTVDTVVTILLLLFNAM